MMSEIFSSRPSSRGSFLRICLALAGCLCLAGKASADEPPPTLLPPQVNAPASSPDDDPKSDPAQTPPSEALPAIVDAEPKPTQSLLKQVDSAFAKAVAAMEKVLFYRIGASTEDYIVYTGHDVYVRNKGETGPFKKLTATGVSETDLISPADLEAKFYRGEFIDAVSEGGRYFRVGTLDGREVEYLKVRIPEIRLGEKIYKLKHNAKFIQEGENYYRVGEMRGLLDQEVFLDPAQIEQLQAGGWLKVEGEGDQKTHLLTAPVGGAPVVVLWLSLGAIVFTLYMRGINFWGVKHSINVIRGRYDNPAEAGEVTHFQALAAALSATVGLGNIAGVTIAMTTGGPGAFFWMICCGLLGMTSKFVECTLGQKYRKVKPDGTVIGGPMIYLRDGLAEMGLARLGAFLAFVFTVMCILASFGGGNMFQINESGKALLKQVQRSDATTLIQIEEGIKQAAIDKDVDKVQDLRKQHADLKVEMSSFATRFNMGYGAVMALLVGVVIIGGIKRIGAAAEKVVPAMCLMYIAACLWIIFNHIGEFPELVGLIFTEAFTGDAIRGGLIGVLVIGVQRAAFSNEAGVGSASIAHSAAKTEEPIREGVVALLEPFIDTIVVCSMTALVILITGAWNNQEWVVTRGLTGAALTNQAFESEINWFTWVLCAAVVLFAFSTVISWSYYGERCCEMLFGPRSIMVYKVLCVAGVFTGAVVNAGSVLDFSDMMILSMAFPNILGLLLLSPKVRADLTNYWKKYKAGEFKTYK